MTGDDLSRPPGEPTPPQPPVADLPADPGPGPAAEPAPAAEPEPAAPPVPSPAAAGPRLGHIVTGAILVLVGVGWLLEALDVADVPWRFLLPSALIIVGVALAFGARTGPHGGLIAVGVLLAILVLAAGAIDALADIPLAGGIGDQSHTPAVLEDEYRWGLGKMTLDLREAAAPAGEDVEASVVVGQLIVIVPSDVPLVITAHAGIGEVVLFQESSGGFDVDLTCRATAGTMSCGDQVAGTFPDGPYLQLNLDVAVGKVEVRR